MIVVEGPDGAGKTTLIKQLVEATGLSVAPRVVSKDAESMVDLKKWTEQNVAKGFQNLIFDRHRLISEPIYGPILRDAPEPGFDDAQWFYEQTALFYECNPLVIYCLPPFKSVWKNIESDPDNWISHRHQKRARMIYQAYLNKATTEQVLRTNTFAYDYTESEIALMLFRFFTNKIKELTK